MAATRAKKTKKPARKPVKRRAPRTLSPKAMESLRLALLAALEAAGDPDTLLQVDVIEPGRAVIRYQATDRIWERTAVGGWSELELTELEAQRCFVVEGKRPMGWHIRCDLERLARPLEHSR